MAKQFPEPTQVKHQPDGEKPGFIKKSEHVGAGHNDSLNRMPHPAQESIPTEPSGEGC